MTKQIKDIVQSGGKEYPLLQYPLDILIRRSGGLPSSNHISTACQRGYFVRWSLENDDLTLIEIYDVSGKPWKEARKRLFSKIEKWKCGKKIVAEWFSGTLIIVIEPVRSGLTSEFINKYEKIIIQKGKIINRKYFVRPDLMWIFYMILILLGIISLLNNIFVCCL